MTWGASQTRRPGLRLGVASRHLAVDDRDVRRYRSPGTAHHAGIRVVAQAEAPGLEIRQTGGTFRRGGRLKRRTAFFGRVGRTISRYVDLPDAESIAVGQRDRRAASGASDASDARAAGLPGSGGPSRAARPSRGVSSPRSARRLRCRRLTGAVGSNGLVAARDEDKGDCDPKGSVPHGPDGSRSRPQASG